jgi:hypothetical protein
MVKFFVEIELKTAAISQAEDVAEALSDIAHTLSRFKGTILSQMRAVDGSGQIVDRSANIVGEWGIRNDVSDMVTFLRDFEQDAGRNTWLRGVNLCDASDLRVAIGTMQDRARLLLDRQA